MSGGIFKCVALKGCYKLCILCFIWKTSFWLSTELQRVAQMPTVLRAPSFTIYKNRFLIWILSKNVLNFCRVLQGLNVENNAIKDENACVLRVPYYKTTKAPENEFTNIFCCTKLSNREYDTASCNLICPVCQKWTHSSKWFVRNFCIAATSCIADIPVVDFSLRIICCWSICSLPVLMWPWASCSKLSESVKNELWWVWNSLCYSASQYILHSEIN